MFRYYLVRRYHPSRHQSRDLVYHIPEVSALRDRINFSDKFYSVLAQLVFTIDPPPESRPILKLIEDAISFGDRLPRTPIVPQALPATAHTRPSHCKFVY